MSETARLCLVLLAIGVGALVVIVAASPWLCRIRIDKAAYDLAVAELRAAQRAERRASDHEAA